VAVDCRGVYNRESLVLSWNSVSPGAQICREIYARLKRFLPNLSHVSEGEA